MNRRVCFNSFVALEVKESVQGRGRRCSTYLFDYETRKLKMMIPHTFNMTISYNKVGWNSRLLTWF